MPSNTPERMEGLKRAYLASLREHGIPTVAARAIGIARQTAYRWAEADPEFALAIKEALQEAADNLEAEARRRAVEGFEKPIFYQGEQVSTVREYSDRLLELMLKARKPEYRDQSKVELTGKLDLSEKSTDELRAELVELAARGVLPTPADGDTGTRH